MKSEHRALSKCWELAFKATEAWETLTSLDHEPLDACDHFKNGGSSGQGWLCC